MELEAQELSESDRQQISECEANIGYRFRDPSFLVQALTHSSIKTPDNPSNERLEFLGDSVLGLVMTEFLYNFYQARDEGELTQIKSAVVSTTALAAESERMQLHEFYNVGKGVKSRRRSLSASLLANVFEAVVAAIYRDSGLENARRFILRNLYHQVLAVAGNRRGQNYKSLLQQWAQRELNLTPIYRVDEEKGPDHNKYFQVSAVLGDKTYSTGGGRSKKEAEQVAAHETLQVLFKEHGLQEQAAELAQAPPPGA